MRAERRRDLAQAVEAARPEPAAWKPARASAAGRRRADPGAGAGHHRDLSVAHAGSPDRRVAARPPPRGRARPRGRRRTRACAPCRRARPWSIRSVRPDRPVLPRHELHEVLLDLLRIGLPGQAEPAGEALHVGVDHDPLVLAEGVAQDDVGGLAADAGQRHERRPSSAAPRRRGPPPGPGRGPSGRAPCCGRSRCCGPSPRAPAGRPRRSRGRWGSGGRAPGVTSLTRLSVHWAERIVATRSWSGVREVEGACGCRDSSRRSRARISAVRGRFAFCDSRRACAGVMPGSSGHASVLLGRERPHQPVDQRDHQAAQDRRQAAVDCSRRAGRRRGAASGR